GKRNQPAYIVNTVNKIASVLNMTTDEIAEATFKNAAHIFNI
ncbi:MAG: TatD family hydrolase, partial [Bacteroidales bacterium]|nr:TatD family hydrolase [Bacteroidales bacterium]